MKTLLENLASTSFTHEKLRALRKQACDDAMRSALRLLDAAGVDDRIECLSGNPGDALADYAHKQLDLLARAGRVQGRGARFGRDARGRALRDAAAARSQGVNTARRRAR
ncbi:MAG: hypothetical protein ACK4V1_04070 [Burkholderiaceae bacterium]